MTKDVAVDGPFKIEIKIVITNGDDTGEVSFELPSGIVPTRESIANALRSVQNMPALEPGGFDLMSRHDFVEYLIEEKTGQRGFAVFGPDEFTIKLDANP